MGLIMVQLGSNEAAWLGEISINKDPSEPKYQQLYTQIRRLIMDNCGLRKDAHLPASRWLAARLGVSRNTVVLAYQRLQEDGYVRGMAGGGTVVTAAAPAAGRPAPARSRTPDP